MQTVCIIGDESRSVADRLAGRLAETHEGRIVMVDCTLEAAEIDTLSETSITDIDAQFERTDDGHWQARGRNRTPMELLDSLAADYEYAVVAGVSHHRLPTVAVGEADPAASVPVVATAPTAAAVDIDDIVERIETFDPHITLETLIKQVKASPQADRSGAIATFTGRVRAKDSPEDARTQQLSFETYEGVAEQRLETIRKELTAREGVFEVLLHHRVGLLEDGEDIVFVVVLAGHREEAFRTVEDGINRLKDEVPIFKKETTTEEEFWLHEQP